MEKEVVFKNLEVKKESKQEAPSRINRSSRPQQKVNDRSYAQSIGNVLPTLGNPSPLPPSPRKAMADKKAF